MTVNQISVFVENTPGALQGMTDVLAQHDIDMRALSLAEAEDFGIVRLIVNDVYNAAGVLKEAGYVYSLTPVVAAAIPDSPGGLNKVLEIIARAGINIDYMYAFLGGNGSKHAYMIFRVADAAAAAAALKKQGINVVDQI